MRLLIVLLLSTISVLPILAKHTHNCNDFLSDSNRAKQVLNKVSQKYKSFRAIEVDFTLQIVNPDANIDEKQAGKLFAKGDKYRVKTKEFERISDGESIWTHFIKEVELQITSFDPEEGELSPARIFTIYETMDFNYEIKEENGKEITIDLVPSSDDETPYNRIRLTVNKSNYLISKATVFENNGTRFVYALSNFKSNVKLNDSYFSFDFENFEGDIIDLTE